MILNTIVKLIIMAISVMISAYAISGVRVTNFSKALLVAVVLALLNIFLKPILVYLSLPITVLTLGLFAFVINILILYLVAAIVKGFVITNFLSALIFSIVLTIVNWFLLNVFDTLIRI